MPRATAIPLVVAAAGLIASPSAVNFLAAALAAAAAAWLLRPIPAADACCASLDPLRPDANTVMEAIRESVRRARDSRRTLTLRLTVPTRSRTALSLDLTRDGDLVLEGARRRPALKLPGVWLPDHPLPLALPAGGSLSLFLEPCEGGRVRAALAAHRRLKTRGWLTLTLLAAAACALDASWLLAAVLGFAFQAYLLQQKSDGPD